MWKGLPMESKFTRVTLVVSLVILARIALYTAVNPMDAVRADLDRELAQVPEAGTGGGDEFDYAEIQQTIAARPTLWRELVAMPAPAPEATKAPVGPKAPDLNALLKGVSIGRGQIGENKVRVLTPEAPNGQWVAVGAQIKGCTLESISAKEVVFTYKWKEGKKSLSLALPRP
jgi:hypothetical protein